MVGVAKVVEPIGGDVNLYRYCGNGPTIYVDPFGLELMHPGDSTPSATLPAPDENGDGISEGNGIPDATGPSLSPLDPILGVSPDEPDLGPGYTPLTPEQSKREEEQKEREKREKEADDAVLWVYRQRYEVLQRMEEKEVAEKHAALRKDLGDAGGAIGIILATLINWADSNDRNIDEQIVDDLLGGAEDLIEGIISDAVKEKIKCLFNNGWIDAALEIGDQLKKVYPSDTSK